jgi:hypothetical protein
MEDQKMKLDKKMILIIAAGLTIVIAGSFIFLYLTDFACCAFVEIMANNIDASTSK